MRESFEKHAGMHKTSMSKLVSKNLMNCKFYVQKIDREIFDYLL